MEVQSVFGDTSIKNRSGTFYGKASVNVLSTSGYRNHLVPEPIRTKNITFLEIQGGMQLEFAIFGKPFSNLIPGRWIEPLCPGRG